MKKLWQKESNTPENDLQKKTDAFTAGSDRHWDLLLADADVRGSRAHAAMLLSVGLLDAADHRLISEGLDEIAELIRNGQFVIEADVEDVHSQVELMLTRSKGDAGKKIHSGRSRNDQSLLDIKLFVRDQIEAIAELTGRLFEVLVRMSEAHKDQLMPGYTHMQAAMPSSFGLWFGAYAESLADDLEFLRAAYNVVNRNPLGSGAGYGSSFPLDRALTTELLHFESMNYNVVYAQMTRGKTEKTMAVAMAAIAATMGRMAMDICLFSGQDFGFISLPADVCTGSSIMPHKKNPDVFELIRARCNRLQALPNELTLLTGNLPSGYHRDLQLSKECLFPAIISLKDCLEMMSEACVRIQVHADLLSRDRYSCLFSVEMVNDLVLQGVPFRDAYREVAARIENGSYKPEKQILHTHMGSMGNLCNRQISERFYRIQHGILNSDQSG